MRDRTEAVESMEQLAVVWRAFVLDRDAGADVRDLPGIAVRWADCRFPFWNCVTLTDVDADTALLGRRLGRAADIMRAKKRPGFLWLFEDLLGDAAREQVRTAAGRAGLAYAFSGTGLTRATLHATAAGAPVYPRIGFRPNSPVHFYALSQPPAPHG
ncbi:hypothetical protein AB0F30_21715 [Streptomyces sp. NPDC029006]|uniref:hypothetical protein n=1 Tax=Streptomyces sp. NPDC029006 TaxID=3155467 RepID=UPI0034070600